MGNAMFNIKDVVFHKKIGLCVIKGNTIINNMDYYVLNSNNDKSKIMIPFLLYKSANFKKFILSD